MFGQCPFPWFLAALVGVAVVSVPGLASAGVVLAITSVSQSGVLACLGMNGDCVYTPATENPAMAFNGGVEAALMQQPSFIAMAFQLQDTSGQDQYASTASTPDFASPLGIAILGTAGEPAGTPVSLRLQTGTGNANAANFFTNSLDNTEYGPNTDQTISGFTVGDTFSYWASVSAPGNALIVWQIELSVQDAGQPVPAPGTLALLMTAGLALGVVALRRR